MYDAIMHECQRCVKPYYINCFIVSRDMYFMLTFGSYNFYVIRSTWPAAQITLIRRCSTTSDLALFIFSDPLVRILSVFTVLMNMEVCHIKMAIFKLKYVTFPIHYTTISL